MAYEIFRRQRAPLAQEPYITIHRRGTIALNAPAWLALGSPAAVELLFDRDTKVMAFRAADDSADHAYQLRQQGRSTSSLVLSGTAFFQYYGIPIESEARRLAARLDDGLLTVDLTQEGSPAAARPPARPQVKRLPKPLDPTP